VSVTTTRPPRPRRDRWPALPLRRRRDLRADALRDGELLEWAVVHGRAKYGTPRVPGRSKAIAAGLSGPLLEIDLQGARQVRASMPEALFVFLAPPSLGRTRPATDRARHRESAEEREIQTDYGESRNLAAAEEFDVVLIVNDNVERVAADLVSLMGSPSETPSRQRALTTCPELLPSPIGITTPPIDDLLTARQQQVRPGHLRREACSADQRLLLAAAGRPAGVRRPARRLPDAREAVVDRAARDQRQPAGRRGDRHPGQRLIGSDVR
jgi:guanylate kinase